MFEIINQYFTLYNILRIFLRVEGIRRGFQRSIQWHTVRRPVPRTFARGVGRCCWAHAHLPLLWVVMVWLLVVPGAVGASPHQLILSHDGRTLFVTVEGEASTAVLETATGQLLRRLAVGLYPKRLAVAPDERPAFLVT